MNSATEYHRLTRYHRFMSGHGLDWTNQPIPYKTYPGAPKISLPRELVLAKAEARLILAGELTRSPQPLTLNGLTQLLFMADGFTSQVDYGQEVFLYRSAPSAGALYPVEVYLTAVGIDGLDDGLYHYDIKEFSLIKLRAGQPPQAIPAPALIFSSIFFRSAWKYHDRSFRYCLLDTGHLVENFVLVAPVVGFKVEFKAEFDDEALGDYLGLNRVKETVLGLLELESERPRPSEGLMDTTPPPQAAGTAPRERSYHLITQVSSLTASPLRRASGELPPWSAGLEKPIAHADWSDFSGPSLVQALQQRRSRRNFRPRAIAVKDLARFLDLIPTSDLGRLVNLGFVGNEIEGLPDGFYHLRPHGSKISLNKKGFLGPPLAEAALSQDWLGRANIIFVFSAPFYFLEEKWGPRAYRSSLLAAGRLGQKIYLAAEVLGWGCCGVGAFFDEEVNSLLNLPPNEEAFYLMPVGPVAKRTHGGR